MRKPTNNPFKSKVSTLKDSSYLPKEAGAKQIRAHLKGGKAKKK